MYKKLKDFSKEIKEEVEPIILEELNRHFSRRFQDIWEYQINSGGKRLRPIILVAASLMYGAEKEKALFPAAAIEIVHNYSLIVDDIIDKSETRRGEKTCWKKYGKTITHCIGIGYAMTYADMISRMENDIAKELTVATKMVTEGEIIDILQERRPNPTEPYIKENKYEDVNIDDYYEMVEKKTSSLIRAACRAGGAIARVGEEDMRKLDEFGRNIGITFQIRDDFLDIFGEEKEFGKKIGKDIIERKGGNIVILYTLQDEQAKKELLPILEKNEIIQKDIDRAMEIINLTDAKEKTEKLGKKYIERAEKILASFPENEYRDLFEELKDYFLIREK